MKISAGETLDVLGLPDAWLRPFDPESAPNDEPAETDLTVRVEGHA